MNPESIELPELPDHRTQYWMYRAAQAEAALQQVIDAPPALMSTPLGLLPVNAEGMRQLADYCAKMEGSESWHNWSEWPKGIKNDD